SCQSSPIIGYPMPVVLWLHDNALQFLSQEEQDCILFFEETIDSLLTAPVVDELDGPGPPILASAPSTVTPRSALDRPTSTKDQDIIDLVRPAQPDLVHPIQAPFKSSMPGTAQTCRELMSLLLKLSFCRFHPEYGDEQP
uniref:Uncharacterized protein n=1 Tax=Oncorhynchus tshawytscha TaxID=74940 RepID=A0A8C8D069_ONCTS